MKRVEKNEKEWGGSTCIYLFSQGSQGSINLNLSLSHNLKGTIEKRG
eukprot:COSAG02_NODE_468_length_21758_cov_41.206796_14_plen_47_part_00